MKLIDFGLITDYLDKDGNHIEESLANSGNNNFAGNVAFCSKNAMNFMRLSRRDDLISLTYMLLYMHQGRLAFADHHRFSPNMFEEIRQIKITDTPE